MFIFTLAEVWTQQAVTTVMLSYCLITWFNGLLSSHMLMLLYDGQFNLTLPRNTKPLTFLGPLEGNNKLQM